MIPVQPSPFDGWASAEMLALVTEARIFRPELAARFVLNRCGARSLLARETAETLADHDPPRACQRPSANASHSPSARNRGRLVSEMDRRTPAAREIAALGGEIERLGTKGTRNERARHPKRLRCPPG